MNDAVGMAVADRSEELLDDDGGFGFGERPAEDPIVERDGVAELGNEAEEIVTLKNINQLQNIGVGREKRHDFGLVLETFSIGFVDQIVLVDGLAGVEVVGNGAKTASDDSESSSADLLEDLVLAVHNHLSHSSILLLLSLCGCSGEFGIRIFSLSTSS